MSRPAKRRLALLVVLCLLAALIGVRIYSWGRPLRPRYLAEAALSGTTREWKIQPQTGGAPWIARDNDGDGTWDNITTPGGTFARPAASATRRWLVVCLDGVPLAMMQSLWDDGHFREFYRPSATVSTFPSDTETALSAALHAAPVPGYEHRYFDRSRNRLRGGAWVTLSGIGIPYIRKLDYDAPGWAKGLPYLLPRKTYRADLNRFRVRFQASHSPVFLAHIAASDALLHVQTAERFRPYLLEFESLLRDIYLDAHGSLGIIVFSDHGNTETLSRSVPLESFLGARGWRIAGSLHQPRDVVIPSYGLVGFAAIYCAPENVEKVAEDLRGIPGANLIVSRMRGSRTATIRAAGGTAGSASGPMATATLEWTEAGRRYRYSARDGDPLGLAAVFDGLRAAHKLDENGFSGDTDLWANTASRYRDPAARIRAWATDEVQNQADILVSLAPGYFHGSGIFRDLVTLAGTHGGLDNKSSLGFVMATYRYPAAIRIGDVIPARMLASAAANPGH